MKTTMSAVPGKIILSGEHAVVYGCPAVGLAINRCVEVEAAWHEKPELMVDIVNFNERIVFPIHLLASTMTSIQKRYQEFKARQRPINEVLEDRFQLIHFIVAQMYGCALEWPQTGVYLKINSHIPLGSGLGSSAAVILAVYAALVPLLNIPLSEERLLQLALEAENLQHGYSSGLDIRICYEGGALIFEENKVTRLSIPHFSFYLVNTGHPCSSTGECVSAVRSYFEDAERKKHFREVAYRIINALKESQQKDLIEAIQRNSRLLENIGVVPERVQHFIRGIEALGGAAKICGAGSISGDSAGMVLIVGEVDPQHLCEYYGYELLELKMHRVSEYLPG